MFNTITDEGLVWLLNKIKQSSGGGESTGFRDRQTTISADETIVTEIEGTKKHVIILESDERVLEKLYNKDVLVSMKITNMSENAQGEDIIDERVITDPVDAALNVTAPDGATVILMDAANHVISKIAEAGKASFGLYEKGNYTYHATMPNGVGYVDGQSAPKTFSVTGDGVVHGAVQFATIHASSNYGLVKSIKMSNTTFDRLVDVYLPSLGTWMVEAVADGTSKTESVNISDYTANSVNIQFAKLTVKTDKGAVIEVLQSSTVLTKKANSGYTTFYLPNAGEWDINGDLAGLKANSKVTFTGFQEETVELIFKDNNLLLMLSGDNVADESLYNHAITNNGVTLQDVPSPVSKKSMYFDRSAQLVLNGTDFNYPGDFTIESWVHPDADNKATAKIYAGEKKGSLFLGFGADAASDIGIGQTSTRWDFKASKSYLPANQWSHLVVCRKDDVVNIYIDGKSVGSATIKKSYGSAGGKVSIGSNYNVYYFKGCLAGLKVSNVARYNGNFTPKGA